MPKLLIGPAVTVTGLIVTGLLVATSLTGCSSGSGATTGGSGNGPSVVAATDVWGDVATAVAGRWGRVSSIITNPAADPHSYEATTRDEAGVARAALVIENGGGYDDFMPRLLAAAGGHPRVINAVAVSGKPAGPDLNEHVWYDFPTVAAVAHAIARDLSAIAHAHRASYTANAHHFVAELRRLEDEEHHIRTAHAGTPVAVTEPVPLYMLQACGLVNATPAAFSHAVEASTGVSARVLAQTLALFANHTVKLLAYNEQTTGAETTEVLAAAKRYDIPVVPVTETLPEGQSYLNWMAHNLNAIRRGLG